MLKDIDEIWQNAKEQIYIFLKENKNYTKSQLNLKQY